MAPQRILRLTLPYTQAELRPSSGRTQAYSGMLPSAQVKAAAAYVQILKQIQRKKKLSMTLVVVVTHLPEPELVAVLAGAKL